MRRAVARVTVCMSECVCVQWDNVALGGGFNEYGLLIGAENLCRTHTHAFALPIARTHQSNY